MRSACGTFRAVGFLARLLRRFFPPRLSTPAPPSQPVEDLVTPRPSRPPQRRSGEYLPRGGDPHRLTGPEGYPAFHLVPGVRYGQEKLFLVEDSTGLLVHSTDARVTALGILTGRMRGQEHYQAAGTAGGFHRGSELTILRQPDNPHDPNAVALAAFRSTRVAGYVGKDHAQRLAPRLDSGQPHRAISTTGTPPGVPAALVMHYLVAPADIVEHLLAERPPDAAPVQFKPLHKNYKN
jgi:hypothetical protein